MNLGSISIRQLSANAVVFMIYSLFGAIFEHLIYGISEKTKALANPILTGFPLYGLGAYIVVFLNKLVKNLNPVVKFVFFGIALTLLEYSVGLYVKAGKNSKDKDGNVYAWDYSDQKWNYKGIISVRSFLMWGTLGLAVSYIHPKLLKAVERGLREFE